MELRHFLFNFTTANLPFQPRSAQSFAGFLYFGLKTSGTWNWSLFLLLDIQNQSFESVIAKNFICESNDQLVVVYVFDLTVAMSLNSAIFALFYIHFWTRTIAPSPSSELE